MDSSTYLSPKNPSNNQRKVTWTIPTATEPSCSLHQNMASRQLRPKLNQRIMPQQLQETNSTNSPLIEKKPLPVKTALSELTWGSVMHRTNSKKLLPITNVSGERLIVTVTIKGPGFKITNLKGRSMTFQPNECRSIEISFYPTVIGAAAGKLSLRAPSGYIATDIPLHAYAGHTELNILDIFKDANNKISITMGGIRELSSKLVQHFHITNKGNLHGFVAIALDDTGLDIPKLCNRIEINPRKIIVPTDKCLKFSITFRPRQEDITQIEKIMINQKKEIFVLANICIITGDEPNRQRILNLNNRMNELDRIVSPYANVIDSISRCFANEVTYPDLKILKEKRVESIPNLLSCLHYYDISLTLSQESNDSFDDMTFLFTEADGKHNTVIEVEGSKRNSPKTPGSESWSVTPSFLEINSFGTGNGNNLKIRNSYKSTQQFKVECNFQNLLTFFPNAGHLEANGVCKINVGILELSPDTLPRETIYIEIHMHNEKMSIPVNIILDSRKFATRS